MNVKVYNRLIEESDFKMVSSLQGVASADAIFNLKSVLERLEFFDEFEDISIQMKDEDDEAELSLVYKDEVHNYHISVKEVSVSHLFNMSHQLTDIETERLKNARIGISVKTHFSEDNLTSYHLQIKVICALLPNISSIIDHNSLSILSGKWAKLCAASNVPPPPSYLYRIHAVAGEKNDVWLHTHGLNRCGTIELEILGASQEEDGYRSLSSIIETLAIKGVDNNLVEKELEPIFLGHNIVVTWKKWEDIIEGLDFIGCSYEDRVGHDAPTGVLFLYASEEDYKNKKLTHTNDIINHLKENPLFFISNKETQRMKELANERIEYVYDHAFQGANKVLMKVGVEVDEEYKDEANGLDTEHLWFELVDITKDIFTGVLLNQPYYIEKLNEKDQLQFKEIQVTDWIIYTEAHAIYPDTIYLLDREKKQQLRIDDKELFIAQLEAWHKVDKHQEIIEACRRIQELDYETSALYCRALNNFGLFQEAVNEMLKHQEKAKNDYKWHYRLAYAYDSLSDYDNALSSINTSLALKNDYASSWVQLAFINDSLNKKKEALEALDKVFYLYNTIEVDVSEDELNYLKQVYKDIQESIEQHQELDLYQLLLDLKEEGNFEEIKSILSNYEINKYHFQLLNIEAHVVLKKYERAMVLIDNVNDEGESHSTWLHFKYQALKGLDNQELALETYKLYEEANRKEKEYVRIYNTENYINVVFNVLKDKVYAISKLIEEKHDGFYMESYEWERVLFHHINKNSSEILKYVKFELEGEQLCICYFEESEENKFRAIILKDLIEDLIENEEQTVEYILSNFEQFGFKK